MFHRPPRAPSPPDPLILCPKRRRCYGVINDYKVFRRDDYQSVPDPAELSLHNIRHFDVSQASLVFCSIVPTLTTQRRGVMGARRAFPLSVCTRVSVRSRLCFASRFPKATRERGFLTSQNPASIKREIAVSILRHCREYNFLIGEPPDEVFHQVKNELSP